MPHSETHPGWSGLVRALHSVGVAAALFPASLPSRLGRAASRPPEPCALTSLLERYYRGDGDVEAGLGRLRQDRIVLHREGDRATARQIVARLRLAAPELGPLGLVEAQDGRLFVRTHGAQEPLAPDLLEEEHITIDGAQYVRRTVTVCALVAATNALLARRGIARRFVPLALADDVECYVAMPLAHALVLDVVGLLDGSFEDVRPLASWHAPARHVA